MRERPVTSHDVARKAGVSRTTVSMVLSNSTAGTFPEETRLRVLEAAAALGYTPNSAARMLVRGNTQTLGLILAHPKLMTIDAFVPQLLYGISQKAQQFGYRVLLEAVENTADPIAYHELVGGKRIDGLIVLNPQVDDKALWSLIDSDFPIVLLGSLRHPKEHTVNFRTGPAIRRMIAHLASLGHRQIGHIALSAPGPIATNARITGYQRALREAGIEPDPRLLAHGDYSMESGHRAMIELLDRNIPVQAVFAANDTLAIGAMAAIRERGLSIPHDIAIVGFDDLPIAAYACPPLTTVRNPPIRQGQLAAEMLIRLMRRETVAEPHLVAETELVVRQSCGASPAGLVG